MSRRLLFYTMEPGATAPQKAHRSDAGFDLYAREEAIIRAGGSHVFDTGLHVGIPEGYFGSIRSKSGLNVNHGIISDGVIDAGYTGSIRVKLYNLSNEDYRVCEGDKISQLIIQPYEDDICAILCASLPSSERGDNGFGSSGR